MPQYGSRRRLLPPAGQEEYGEVMGEAEEEYEEEEVNVMTLLSEGAMRYRSFDLV